MDQSLNDYFRKGMLTAVNRLEQKGIFLPAPDFGLKASSSDSSMEASMLHPARHWGRGSVDYSSGERPASSGGVRMVRDVDKKRRQATTGTPGSILSSKAYVPPSPVQEATASREARPLQRSEAGSENVRDLRISGRTIMLTSL